MSRKFCTCSVSHKEPDPALARGFTFYIDAQALGCTVKIDETAVNAEKGASNDASLFCVGASH